jgi:hypothetical protein
MIATAAGSVRIKLILTALATTFVALVVTTVSMLVYDLQSFQQGWVDDLTTQAELIATASAPALSAANRGRRDLCRQWRLVRVLCPHAG